MQNIIKLIFTFLVAGVFISCEKKVSEVVFEGGTAPVLSANRTGTIPMAFATRDQEALKLTWTNPNYSFSTGTSSHSVGYLIEIDTTGANFTNPKKKTLSVSSSLEKSFTQNELNDYLLNTMELAAGVPHDIEIRVTSSIGVNSGKLMSNVLKYKVTPYAIPPKVAAPASGKLFITGGATPAGWMAGGDAEVASQRFQQVTPTLYVLNNIALKANESFLFVPVYGNWTDKYGFAGDGNKNNVDGDEFSAGGNDIKAPATAGNYKIEVNFQTGRYTLTKL